jgi:N4-gp56 family major capsid protein
MSATFTWTFDAPTGVYKNHALSGKLLEVAAKKFKFVPFTKKINGYGRKMGEKINLFYYKPLAQPTSAELEEKTRIPIDVLQMGQQSITIKEWGRGVEYSDLAEQLSAFSPAEGAQKALVDQMNEAMDNAAAAQFTSTDAKICFIPTTLTGGTWDTDGTPSTQATVNITKDHMAVIRDYMVNTIHVPPYEGDYFIGLFATRALRGLKNDRVIQAFNLYLQKGDLLYKNEIGMIENIRLVEINNEGALSDSIGANGVLGEGVVFGDYAVGRIEIDFPHLRAQPNYTADFGRRHAVAWYGTVGFGVPFPTATDREARIVRVTSS